MANKAQGDVVLVSIPKSDAYYPGTRNLETDGDRVIVHRGEGKGHAHAIPKDKIKVGSGIMTGRNFGDTEVVAVIEALEDTQMTHEEHAPVNLKKGETYAVSLQRQYQDERDPVAVSD